MRHEGLDDLAEAQRLVRDGEARVRHQLGMIVLLEQRGQAALGYDARKLKQKLEAARRRLESAEKALRSHPHLLS